MVAPAPAPSSAKSPASDSPKPLLFSTFLYFCLLLSTRLTLFVSLFQSPALWSLTKSSASYRLSSDECFQRIARVVGPPRFGGVLTPSRLSLRWLPPSS